MVRLLSGLVLGTAAVAAVLFLPATGLLLVACAVAWLAASEYQRLVNASVSLHWAAALVCYLVGSRAYGEATFGVLLVVVGYAVAGAVLLRDDTLGRAAAAAFGLIYVAVPLGALVLVHRLGGAEAVLLLIFTIVVSDSAQYYTGRLVGRRPLAPAISPKKTVEGALGGVLIGTAFVVVAGRIVFPFVRPPQLVALGLALVALGIAGDLFESRLKRTAGLKDSSRLIPGHGGLLDRIDALLFAIPVYYLFVNEVM
ncbi:MAG: phosphatidate cytidylyltransferase [Vicinamibacterales bacterium]